MTMPDARNCATLASGLRTLNFTIYGREVAVRSLCGVYVGTAVSILEPILFAMQKRSNTRRTAPTY
jgi:hypothetical protein